MNEAFSGWPLSLGWNRVAQDTHLSSICIKLGIRYRNRIGKLYSKNAICNFNPIFDQYRISSYVDYNLNCNCLQKINTKQIVSTYYHKVDNAYLCQLSLSCFIHLRMSVLRTSTIKTYIIPITPREPRSNFPMMRRILKLVYICSKIC